MMRWSLIGWLVWCSCVSCAQEDCRDLPASFDSYAQVYELIESIHFTQDEVADCSASSWIRSARFLSCSSEPGFLIIETDKRRYIYLGVPGSTWEAFKRADSKGSYFNKFIKGRYGLQTDTAK